MGTTPSTSQSLPVTPARISDVLRLSVFAIHAITRAYHVLRLTVVAGSFSLPLSSVGVTHRNPAIALSVSC